MPKIDLGGKQVCPACGSKFYDLHKRPAQCPKCGNVFDPDDETIKAKRIRSRLNVVEPEADEDDEDVVLVKKAVDPDDEDERETEMTPELDAADEPPLVLGDDDDEGGTVAPEEALPDGFAEADLDVPPEDDDDDVPFLTDDDDDVDDLDDIPGEDDADLL